MQVREKSIIGIFDLDNAGSSKITNSFFRQAEENGQVVTVCDDLPKSFLLCREYGMDTVYLLQPNSKTMEKRLNRSSSVRNGRSAAGLTEETDTPGVDKGV